MSIPSSLGHFLHSRPSAALFSFGEPLPHFSGKVVYINQGSAQAVPSPGVFPLTHLMRCSPSIPMSLVTHSHLLSTKSNLVSFALTLHCDFIVVLTFTHACC
jgi:hypothetical protein